MTKIFEICISPQNIKILHQSKDSKDRDESKYIIFENDNEKNFYYQKNNS